VLLLPAKLKTSRIVSAKIHKKEGQLQRGNICQGPKKRGFLIGAWGTGGIRTGGQWACGGRKARAPRKKFVDGEETLGKKHTKAIHRSTKPQGTRVGAKEENTAQLQGHLYKVSKWHVREETEKKKPSEKKWEKGVRETGGGGGGKKGPGAKKTT